MRDVVAEVEVDPPLAPPARVHALQVRDLEQQVAARPQRPLDPLERLLRSGQVLDDVPRADDVEAVLRQVDVLDDAGLDVEAEPLARLPGHRLAGLDALHLEAGRARLVEEVPRRRADLEQPARVQVLLHERDPDPGLVAALRLVLVVGLAGRVLLEVLVVVELLEAVRSLERREQKPACRTAVKALGREELVHGRGRSTCPARGRGRLGAGGFTGDTGDCGSDAKVGHKCRAPRVGTAGDTDPREVRGIVPSAPGGNPAPPRCGVQRRRAWR